ncbi:hypothetical protein AG1IA_04707 [Rhizoctonia solani AG-1 IA]|uniref:Uncharacterized protein n=1 Tax=Thanatephorus cucumeris (strain AG1-IA) TaxID=983506 RepID=L8WWX9_THACA|nr:hypothetical protein AG1IA_04707 [Rhizoctonia solani AG-1 IA]
MVVWLWRLYEVRRWPLLRHRRYPHQPIHSPPRLNCTYHHLTLKAMQPISTLSPSRSSRLHHPYTHSIASSSPSFYHSLWGLLLFVCLFISFSQPSPMFNSLLACVFVVCVSFIMNPSNRLVYSS